MVILHIGLYTLQSVMSSEKEGESLESAESLLKKHEDFQKSLSAQEEKFKVIEHIRVSKQKPIEFKTNSLMGVAHN